MAFQIREGKDICPKHLSKSHLHLVDIRKIKHSLCFPLSYLPCICSSLLHQLLVPFFSAWGSWTHPSYRFYSFSATPSPHKTAQGYSSLPKVGKMKRNYNVGRENLRAEYDFFPEKNYDIYLT